MKIFVVAQNTSHKLLLHQIRIDGQDIREVMLESLRKCIGVVPQDTVSLQKAIYLFWFIFSLMHVAVVLNFEFKLFYICFTSLQI